MGTKKQLLFLHGYLSSSDSFYCQIPYFSRYFEVYAIDFQGFGKNKGMDTPYSLDDYITQLKEFMSNNNIVKPHVIAHSFGARVAIKMASYDQDVFDKLVLTGAAGLKPKQTLKKIVKKGVFNLLKKFTSKDKLKKFYSQDYLSLDPVMQQSFIKIVNEHLDDRLKFIVNKTLILFGDKDGQTPLYMAKRLNKNIRNSKLKILRGAGHFCFIDKPYTFNMEVENFLFSK